MTSTEIRSTAFSSDSGAWECATWLQEIAAQLAELNEKIPLQDNPQCFCPDCGTDVGKLYSNRIRMERTAQKKG